MRDLIFLEAEPLGERDQELPVVDPQGQVLEAELPERFHGRLDQLDLDRVRRVP